MADDKNTIPSLDDAEFVKLARRLALETMVDLESRTNALALNGKDNIDVSYTAILYVLGAISRSLGIPIDQIITGLDSVYADLDLARMHAGKADDGNNIPPNTSLN